jgi:hypothetical protein
MKKDNDHQPSAISPRPSSVLNRLATHQKLGDHDFTLRNHARPLIARTGNLLDGQEDFGPHLDSSIKGIERLIPQGVPRIHPNASPTENLPLAHRLDKKIVSSGYDALDLMYDHSNNHQDIRIRDPVVDNDFISWHKPSRNSELVLGDLVNPRAPGRVEDSRAFANFID